jgi:hypothetical protein
MNLLSQWSQTQRTFCVAAVLCLAFAPRATRAFPHIVQAGETLASMSERFYGKVQNERLLVAANGLDQGVGVRIAPGMRLEIPALLTVRVSPRETWKELSLRYLGAESRAFAVANLNGSQPWLFPEVGSEILIPYNLRVVAKEDDTIVGLAYRYLGDRKAAWMLDQYNQREGRQLVRGEVLLLPLVDVKLTQAGKDAAKAAAEMTYLETRTSERDQQLKVQQELPALARLLRQGQYAEALRSGTELLTISSVSPRQSAVIYRALWEAYVALGVSGRATEACAHWMELDAKAKLDPVQHSPKLIAACPQRRGSKPALAPMPSPSSSSAAGAQALTPARQSP